MAHSEENIIGPGSVFQGKLTLQGNLRIEGRYESPSLEVTQLHIGRRGRVRTAIHADSVVVEGILIGSVHAKVRVILMPTARIHGDIVSPELIIQNGVMFEGTCRISRGDESSVSGVIEDLYQAD